MKPMPDGGETIRVLRVYHVGEGTSTSARASARWRAAGTDVTLVVPSEWPEGAAAAPLTSEPSRVVELPVRRAGDINRHAYADEAMIERLIADVRPDVLDIHEEPFSVVVRQLAARRAALAARRHVQRTKAGQADSSPPYARSTSASRTVA